MAPTPDLHCGQAAIHNLDPTIRDRSEPVDRGRVDNDAARDYPWLAEHDDRFTLALVLDVCEVLARHGYPAPTGATLVDLAAGLHHALHGYRPPPLH